ncbi:MAG: hypothetical protein SCARUB_00518 [Candidatus Scalindua rubra]|uniref:PIN domain-containing protein n=1 Tax=Candidatus Scalindua rubra TaxID=1872076 RepID=A0A1E3XFH3_9BACT|nr:MAG: hypothetical protein SCARUB_00518 [Candidatus Scalindua rubra]
MDTNVIRNLCYADEPWITTFQKMASDGYHFCLSDILFAEFLEQFERGSIIGEQYRIAIQRANMFVSRTLPVLPGKAELYQMSGIKDKHLSNDFDPEYTQRDSEAKWGWMKALSEPADLAIKVVRVKVGNQAYKYSFQAGVAARTLDEERLKWSQFVKQFDALTTNRIREKRTEILKKMAEIEDNWADCDPPLSVRFDLWNKNLFETVAQRSISKEPYNPESNKRKNDGIDFLLKQAFLLPALVCTADKNFIGRFANIDSFQKEWIYTPEDLTDAWTRKEITRPEWPS